MTFMMEKVQKNFGLPRDLVERLDVQIAELSKLGGWKVEFWEIATIALGAFLRLSDADKIAAIADLRSTSLMAISDQLRKNPPKGKGEATDADRLFHKARPQTDHKGGRGTPKKKKGA